MKKVRFTGLNFPHRMFRSDDVATGMPICMNIGDVVEMSDVMAEHVLISYNVAFEIVPDKAPKPIPKPADKDMSRPRGVRRPFRRKSRDK